MPEPWIFEIAICVGLAFLAFLLMGLNRLWQKKIGELLLLIASGLAAWFLTHNLFWTAIGALIWIILPVTQAIWMSRRMKLPAKRVLESTTFDGEEFEDIHELSQELRKQGFVMEGDYWLKPFPVEQGYRLFSHPQKQTFAAIGLIRRGFLLFEYLILLTCAADRKFWLTWDHPTTRVLMMPPDIAEYRLSDVPSVTQFVQQHEEFLKINHVALPQTLEKAKTIFENLFEGIVQYNVRQGLLQYTSSSAHLVNTNTQNEKDQDANATALNQQPSLNSDSYSKYSHLHYTWRGTAFVFWRVFREVLGIG